MKTLPLAILSAALWTSGSACAASLMVNFRSTSANAAASGNVAAPYLTLSPGHADTSIPLAETSWNNFSGTAASSSLVYGDGTAATGVTLTFGTETSAGSGTIDLTNVTGINTSSLYGTGGATPGMQPLAGNAGSIYGSGNNSSNSAVGRAGWFGGGTATAGNAVGLRVDGLAAGGYRVYVMARNTNSNVTSLPMNVHASTGAFSTTFDFTLPDTAVQANTGYATTNTTAFNALDPGNNFVSFDLTLAAGQSLFVASDGGSGTETRGFLNMVQIVSIPEPSVALLGLAGLMPFLRRRR